jgi:hypothetical protein
VKKGRYFTSGENFLTLLLSQASARLIAPHFEPSRGKFELMESVAPKISLSQSNLTVEWGRSHVQVHVDDAAALAKILEGVGQLVGTEARDDFSFEQHAGVEGSKSASKKRRKSRKNVGDALVIWMSAHPGWHSEEKLLATVIAHRMSDAEPKRALKIALGRKKDEVFVTDGLGNWQLKEDVEMASKVKHLQPSGASEDTSRWDSSSAQEIARARRNLLGV